MIRVLGAHVGAGDKRMAGKETPAEYAETHGYTYPMVADARDIATAFDVADKGIPYFIVVDPDGKIVAEHLGRLKDDVRDRLADAARAARPSG